MSALGAEGRRFKSCLPDHISAVSRHSRAATHGIERKNESGNGAEVPGIVPDGFAADGQASPVRSPSSIALREQIMQRRRASSTAAAYASREASFEQWQAGLPQQVEPLWAPREDLAQRFVYFLGDKSHAIKIGCSANVQKRLLTIQTASPLKLTLYAVTDGGFEREERYHATFAAHRLHGEWFAPHPDILAEIDRLKAMQEQAA